MKLIRFFQLSLFFITLLVMICFPSFAFAQVPADSTGSAEIWAWLAANWELVLLVSSELLAFLPAKFSGIVKGLLTIIGKIILLLARKSNK